MTRTVTRSSNLDKAVAIVAIVFGILILLGEFTVTWLLPILGLILVVVGILILTRTLTGGMATGAVLLVVGLLLLTGLLDLPPLAGRVLNLIVGAALLVVGILKLL